MLCDMDSQITSARGILEECQRLLIEAQYVTVHKAHIDEAVSHLLKSVKPAGEESRWNHAGLSRCGTGKNYAKGYVHSVVDKLGEAITHTDHARRSSSGGSVCSEAMDMAMESFWHDVAVAVRRAKDMKPTQAATSLLEDLQTLVQQLDSIAAKLQGTYPSVDYTQPINVPPSSSGSTYYPSPMDTQQGSRSQCSDPGQPRIVNEYREILGCIDSVPSLGSAPAPAGGQGPFADEKLALTVSNDLGLYQLQDKPAPQLTGTRSEDLSLQDCAVLSWLSDVGVISSTN